MTMREWIDLFEARDDLTPGQAWGIFLDAGIELYPEVDEATLKKLFRGWMMTNHPDKGGDVGVAQNVARAYDVLKDNLARAEAEYRRFGFAAANDSGYRASRPEAKPGFSMDRPDFKNIDFIKFYFKELTKDKPAQDWTVMNFDGHFFRGMFTVRGNYDLFPKMARAMEHWDRHYACDAVFAGTEQMMRNGTILVIWIAGMGMVDPHISLSYESMNLNPANDQQFCRKLPAIISAIEDGSFVSQNMID